WRNRNISARKLFQRNQKVSLIVGAQRGSESFSLGSWHPDFIQIQDTRVIQTPLHGIDRFYHRSFSGSLSGNYVAALATANQNRSLSVGQLYFAIQHRDGSSPIRRH